MPNRILRDGILDSEKVDALSIYAEVFYRRMMSIVDDYGRYQWVPRKVRSAAYPLKTDAIALEDLETWLNECCMVGLIVRYRAVGKEYEGKEFIEFVNFHQRTRTDSKFPPPGPMPVSDGGQLAVIGQQCAARASSSPSPSPSSSNTAEGEPELEKIPVASEAMASLQGSMTASGECLGFSSPQVPRRESPDSPNASRDLWIDAAWFRHPKKKNIAMGYAALQSVYDKGPEIRQAFGRHHEAACKSREWRKEGGRFCPQIHDYVNNKQYLGEVYDEDECGDGYSFEVPEL